MDGLIFAVIQTSTVVITVIVMSIRLEHRITKIETDVKWLKLNNNTNCRKETKDE